MSAVTEQDAELDVDPDEASTTLDDDVEVTGYERSPLDVLRVLVLVAAAAGVAVLTRYLRDGVDGLEGDLSQLLEAPWPWARGTLDVVLIALVVVSALALLVVPLVTRRFRLFGYVVVADIATSLIVGAVVGWLGLAGDDAPARTADQVARSVSIDVVGTAQLVAAIVAVAPFLGRRWRRAAGWVVVAVIALRLLVASGESTHAMLALTTGAAIGSAVLLAFGRPDTRPRRRAILAALRQSGLPVTDLRPAAVDARGSVPYFATNDDGSELFVKVLGTDERAADLMFRLVRLVRLRDVGDERPFSSLRRTVEHEALVALRARDVEVRTPRLRSAAPVGRDSFLLAYDLITGRSMDSVEPDRLSAPVLEALWEQVALLRRYRIAHRDLRLANVFLAGDDQPWIIDFGFSEIAASDTLLRADVAELLAATSVVVGPERAVAPAVAVLGPDAVAASLGRLQPAALSGATRSATKAHKGALVELRAEVERVCDAPEPTLEPVTRVGGRQLFTIAMLVAVFYFLVPQLADLPGIVDQVGEADWGWTPLILLASAATYVGATLGILGAVPDRLPFGATAAAQVGSSFASKVAPAGLGGMALNLRFLQRQGVDTAVATSSVGLNAGGGVVAHVVLAGIFLLWARNDAFSSLSLPSPRALLIGLAVVALLAGGAMLVPATRRLVVGRLFPILGKALAGLRDVLIHPSKVGLLLFGSAFVTMAYVAAFALSARAFEIDTALTTVAAVYLVGSAIATAAPTPGGLGATEAALIGGLVAVGIDDSQAVPAVFLFRLATFWVPVLPGWFAFTWLRRTERL